MYRCKEGINVDSYRNKNGNIPAGDDMTDEQKFDEFKGKLNEACTATLHHCKTMIDVLTYQASMDEAVARNRESKLDAQSRAKSAKIIQQLTAKVAELEKSAELEAFLACMDDDDYFDKNDDYSDKSDADPDSDKSDADPDSNQSDAEPDSDSVDEYDETLSTPSLSGKRATLLYGRSAADGDVADKRPMDDAALLAELHDIDRVQLDDINAIVHGARRGVWDDFLHVLSSIVQLFWCVVTSHRAVLCHRQ